MALEKLSKVKLLDDRWRTGPNRSRPASCVVEEDIDTEDQAERDPQKGQWGSCVSRSRAIRSVAIEVGLCRSGWTRRAARPELRRTPRAMDNGMMKAQASEVLTHLAFYVGWPNVFSALPVAKGVFEERDK
jgi:hypothetical protein